MSVNSATGENCRNFMVFNYEVVLQTRFAMPVEDKVIKLFCMADGFCSFFDIRMEKIHDEGNGKCKCTVIQRSRRLRLSCR